MQCRRHQLDSWVGKIPGSGRSPGEWRGYPLQYSGLEISMDCVVYGVAKSQTRLRDFHFHFLSLMTCIEHYGVLQSIFTALKILCVLPVLLFPTSSPDSYWYFYYMYSFAFSRMSCSCIRIVFILYSCSILRLFTFFCWYAFKVFSCLPMAWQLISF